MLLLFENVIWKVFQIAFVNFWMIGTSTGIEIAVTFSIFVSQYRNSGKLPFSTKLQFRHINIFVWKKLACNWKFSIQIISSEFYSPELDYNAVSY